MPRKNDTNKDEVLRFIEHYHGENGFAPTYQEISSELNLSVYCVSARVQELVDEGVIERKSRGHRALRIIS
jgi:predicted transcriptional regulator